MRKIGLILFMVFWSACMYADGGSSAAKQEARQRKIDSIQRVIQYDNFVSFVKDSLQYNVKDTAKYKTRDEEIQANLDSIYNKRLQSLDDDMEKAKSGTYSNTMLWVRILLFSLTFLLIISVVYFILYIRGLQNELDEVVECNNGLNKRLSENATKYTSISSSKSYYEEVGKLQNENRNLMNRMAALEDMLRERKIASEMELSTPSNQQPTSRPVEAQKQLYADSIIDGVFSHVKEQENDDTVFVLKLKSETDASITLYRGAYNKVLANASYLEGCDKQLIGNNSVEIIREGKAEKGFNGKWKVLSPLKVEIR